MELSPQPFQALSCPVGSLDSAHGIQTYSDTLWPWNLWSFRIRLPWNSKLIRICSPSRNLCSLRPLIAKHRRQKAFRQPASAKKASAKENLTDNCTNAFWECKKGQTEFLSKDKCIWDLNIGATMSNTGQMSPCWKVMIHTPSLVRNSSAMYPLLMQVSLGFTQRPTRTARIVAAESNLGHLRTI